MPKCSLLRILLRYYHLAVFIALVTYFLIRLWKCPFYEYRHIPLAELNSSLYKQVNINLQVFEDRPTCQFNFNNKSSISKYDIPKVYNEFSPLGINDGSYSPEHCNPEISVAILVTYRNRQEQLNIFLPYIHNFLRKQDIHYKVYLIEQTDELPFNKGLLYNIGAKIALSEKFPCLILHDVDLLPLSVGNLYACTRQPRHMSAVIDKFRYVLTYPELVGGVLAVTEEHFRLVNGFSNRFLDWGGEDDNFADRLMQHQLDIVRFPRWLSEYTMLVHRQQRVNPERGRLLSQLPEQQAADGYLSLNYRTLSLQQHRLFMHLSVTT